MNTSGSSGVCESGLGDVVAVVEPDREHLSRPRRGGPERRRARTARRRRRAPSPPTRRTPASRRRRPADRVRSGRRSPRRRPARDRAPRGEQAGSRRWRFASGHGRVPRWDPRGGTLQHASNFGRYFESSSAVPRAGRSGPAGLPRSDSVTHRDHLVSAPLDAVRVAPRRRATGGRPRRRVPHGRVVVARPRGPVRPVRARGGPPRPARGAVQLPGGRHPRAAPAAG